MPKLNRKDLMCFNSLICREIRETADEMQHNHSEEIKDYQTGLIRTANRVKILLGGETKYGIL